MSLLNFLRYYEVFRSLIDLIISCAGVVSTFFVVFFIMIMSFAAAQYYKEIMNLDSDVNSEISQNPNFFGFLKNEYFSAFGDFSYTEDFSNE
jgi:hypothetical protein